MAEFREYRFLVPLAPEGDYAAHHRGVKWDALKDALLEVAGGYTDAGEVIGAWRDGGRVVQEYCRQFFVSVPLEKEQKLTAILWLLVPKFAQKSIYVVCGEEAWLVNCDAKKPTAADETWARNALRLDVSASEKMPGS